MRYAARTREWREEVVDAIIDRTPEPPAVPDPIDWYEIDEIVYEMKVYMNCISLFTYLVFVGE